MALYGFRIWISHRLYSDREAQTGCRPSVALHMSEAAVFGGGQDCDKRPRTVLLKKPAIVLDFATTPVTNSSVVQGNDMVVIYSYGKWFMAFQFPLAHEMRRNDRGPIWDSWGRTFWTHLDIEECFVVLLFGVRFLFFFALF
ncbi:uncharacterized protein LOC143776491 [Ranitomeya variabilis]|uniref:uncharacterized protein LOC143776491 n=1 Tax=Ranitomeya variabilis TaxID=490064 RepID=UPI00405640BF